MKEKIHSDRDTCCATNKVKRWGMETEQSCKGTGLLWLDWSVSKRGTVELGIEGLKYF